jgi:hypothetical protein
MGFFNKILVQETKTGNLTDITNLDEKHYESFLEAMQQLQAAYIIAKRNKPKPRVFSDTVSPLGKDILDGKL